MAQYEQMAVAFAGLKADIGFDNVLTYSAAEDISFGSAVFYNNKSVFLPYDNISTITFDTDFVTSNVINVDVNGVSIAPVTFATDDATTRGLLADAINDASSVVSAVVGGANEIVVTSVGAGGLEFENFLVTGGASQAVVDSIVTSASASSLPFAGVALHTHAVIPGCNGETLYKAKTPVNVLSRGRVYVFAETDINVGDSLFVRLVASGVNKAGQFRNSADGSDTLALTAPIRVTTGAKAGSFAVIEINLP